MFLFSAFGTLEASPVLGNPFVGIIYLDCEGTDLHLYLFVSAHFLERLYFTAHLFAYRDTRWEKKEHQHSLRPTEC